MTMQDDMLWLLIKSSGRIEERLDDLEALVRQFARAERERDIKNMAAIDDKLDEGLALATEEDDKIDSMIVLLQTLSSTIGLNAEQQAKFDAMLEKLRDNPARIQAAIDANTLPA